MIAQHGADITCVDIIDPRQTYFEIDVTDGMVLLEDLSKLPVVRKVAQVKTHQAVFGKRIIIIGGGAQVGQVATGAISEADRHNIRGEHISVDTIPLVGEQPRGRGAGLRAVASSEGSGARRRLDGRRYRASRSREVRAQDLPVASLNMAGSVRAADLVVTDPLRAGVMTVMVVAESAKFSLGG